MKKLINCALKIEIFLNYITNIKKVESPFICKFFELLRLRKLLNVMSEKKKIIKKTNFVIGTFIFVFSIIKKI